MKKARKKRIVRRKRRISEREIMRIKRKLKKSARKLRLGAKRTGAYVYGTLRRITGNPLSYYVGGLSSLGAKRESQRRMRTYNQIKKSIQRGNASYGELAVLQSLAKEHPKLFAGDPMMAEAGGMSEAQFRRLRGNPYPTGGMTPLERLRYHVSGAIARGEAKPITDLSGLVPRKPRMVRVLGYDVVEGSKKHMRLLAQKRHFDDLQRGERGLRGNPGKLFPASYPPEKKADSFPCKEGGMEEIQGFPDGNLSVRVEDRRCWEK